MSSMPTADDLQGPFQPNAFYDSNINYVMLLSNISKIKNVFISYCTEKF